ncbi:MAG: hypothetical protein P8K08_26070 [Fuerstiella sp.]|jgi:hypothetical protein|nr:hypothetical protein [Fuerstiella sp.]
MPDLWLYVKAMVSAAAVSALCVLATVVVRRKTDRSWLNTACVSGIGFGLAVGCGVLSLLPVWPPANGLDRFLTVLVPAVLSIELLAGIQRVPLSFLWALRIGLATAAPLILLYGSVYLSGFDNDWPLRRTSTVMAACSALLTGVWALLGRLAQRSPGVSIPFAVCLTTQCAGLTVMMAGYIKGGAAALLLVAVLLATIIAARLMARRFGEVAENCTLATLGVGVVSLFGVLFIGRFFGRLSTGSALIMLLAPLICWATELPQLRHRKPWVVGWLRITLVSVPLVFVLVEAKRDFVRDMAPLLGQGEPATIELTAQAGDRTAGSGEAAFP